MSKRWKRFSHGALHVVKHPITIAIVALVLGILVGSYMQNIVYFAESLVGVKHAASQLDLSSLQETYSLLKANYNGAIDDQKLIDGAEHGMVNAVGDKFTVYFNQNESEDFDNDLSGSIGGGIGAGLSDDNNQISITNILKGTPAEKIGLQKGDVIQAVNDESTAGWSADKAVSKIRGDEGTTVKLRIKRGDAENDYSITRAVISVPSVDSTFVNGILTLSVSRFDTDTASLARTAVKNAQKQGTIKGVVVDLRDNGGGYLDSAVGLAGVWLNNELIVTEKSTGGSSDSQKTQNIALIGNTPTVILVNKNTASASEIFSGAMRYYKKATLVGATTYGKGSVQNLFSLSNNATLKVTIARWYMPDNVNINGKGIKPDYAVTYQQQGDSDTQMLKALELLK